MSNFKKKTKIRAFALFIIVLIPFTWLFAGIRYLVNLAVGMSENPASLDDICGVFVAVRTGDEYG